MFNRGLRRLRRCEPASPHPAFCSAHPPLEPLPTNEFIYWSWLITRAGMMVSLVRSELASPFHYSIVSAKDRLTDTRRPPALVRAWPLPGSYHSPLLHPRVPRAAQSPLVVTSLRPLKAERLLRCRSAEGRTVTLILARLKAEQLL